MSKHDTATPDVIQMTIGRVTNDELEQAVAVWFKDEDEIRGVAIGPIWVQTSGSVPNAESNPMPADAYLVPFDKGTPEWFEFTVAELLAKELNVPMVRA